MTFLHYSSPISVFQCLRLLGLIGWLAMASPAVWGQNEDDMYDMEMEEGGYGDGEFGDGGRSQGPRDTTLVLPPTPIAMAQLFAPDWQPVVSEFASLVADQRADAGPTIVGPKLRNESHIAMRYGNLPLARELYYGHLARGSEAAIADLESIQFSGHLRRPAWHLRWAMSVGLHGDTEAEPSPIKAGQTGMGDRSGMGDFGMDEMSGMEDEMMMEDMEMDTEMMEMEMEMEMDGSNMGRQPGGRSAAPAAPVIPDAQMTNPEVTQRLDELMGLVATTVANGLETRFRGGNFGRALMDVAEEDETQGYTVGGDTVSPSEHSMWLPGIPFLGEANSRETVEMARQQNVEFLVHFDVALKEFRGGQVQNISRVKVIDIRSGKTVVSSGGMDSREVSRLLSTNRGSAEGHIAEQLETFWKILDSRLALIPFPTLSADVVKRRISQLVADNSLSTLRKLAEIRLYAHQGLLTEDETAQAFEIAGSIDAITILYGAESQAIEAVRSLAIAAANGDS